MRAYLELGKPRIAAMSALTAALGYRLAGGREAAVLAWTAAGTILAAFCTGSLNQYLERREDALMLRTRGRPLPSGRVEPGRALAFGLLCGAFGLALLAAGVNFLACALTAFTVLSYLGVYTPLKKVTPHSTWVGSVSGAMPPLIGWAAARGTLAPEAWALFAIQFLWQIPHFLAMFWLYREDYARAGFRTMPVVDPQGRSTAAQIALHSFTLLPASLMPVLCGLSGLAYGAAALMLSTAYLGLGLRASWTMAPLDTRRLFFASLAYLPILFGLLAVA